MGKIKHLAWLLSFSSTCVFLLATGSSKLQEFVSAHHDVPSFLLLSIVLAIPTSLATLICGYVIEGLMVGWSRSSLAVLWMGRASVKLDVLAIAMMLLPHKRLDYVLSLGLLYVIDIHSGAPADFSLSRFVQTWGIQVSCVLVLQSCVSYWVHRLEHTIPALWALHSFHHSADRMSILNSERNTLLAKAVESALRFLPLALLGAATAPKPTAGAALVLVTIYFIYTNFLRVNGYLCHSNLSSDYGWIGRWLIVSPRMHRLHHATSPEYHNRNFTFDLVIWDRLFGTYASCDARTAAALPLGLTDSPFNSSATFKGVLRDYFLTTYGVFWQALRKGFKAWRPAQDSFWAGTSQRVKSISTGHR
jgi:sterol desaturase/sphingolipid hydroxylase (fatty acid hydroxylase superfamily)